MASDRDDLKAWSKNDLIREVLRLREISSSVLSRSGAGPLEFESGVNSQGKPFVRCWWGEQSGQLDVEDAYQHARKVMQVAAAAAHDAAFFRLFRDKLDVPEGTVAQILVDLREYREDLGEHASQKQSGHASTALRREKSSRPADAS